MSFASSAAADNSICVMLGVEPLESTELVMHKEVSLRCQIACASLRSA